MWSPPNSDDNIACSTGKPRRFRGIGEFWCIYHQALTKDSAPARGGRTALQTAYTGAHSSLEVASGTPTRRRCISKDSPMVRSPQPGPEGPEDREEHPGATAARTVELADEAGEGMLLT